MLKSLGRTIASVFGYKSQIIPRLMDRDGWAPIDCVGAAMKRMREENLEKLAITSESIGNYLVTPQQTSSVAPEPQKAHELLVNWVASCATAPEIRLCDGEGPIEVVITVLGDVVQLVRKNIILANGNRHRMS